VLLAVYTNQPPHGGAHDFFVRYGATCRCARLASPFFTTSYVLNLLPSAEVQLLVRLCQTTQPSALEEASKHTSVQIRYFTDKKFHSKLYILDEVALLGSANLTRAGLSDHYELSVAIAKSDPNFTALELNYAELWSLAQPLTNAALADFADWHSKRPASNASDYEGVGEEEELETDQDDVSTATRLVAAAVQTLREMKKPTNARNLFQRLTEQGFDVRWASEMRRPYRLLHARLLAREKKNGDIVKLSGSMWALCEWFDEAERDRLRGDRLKQRDPEHVERTLRGMRRARELGKQIGAPRKITIDLVERIARLYRDGKSVKDIASELRVAPNTIYNNLPPELIRKRGQRRVPPVASREEEDGA